MSCKQLLLFDYSITSLHNPFKLKKHVSVSNILIKGPVMDDALQRLHNSFELKKCISILNIP